MLRYSKDVPGASPSSHEQKKGSPLPDQLDTEPQGKPGTPPNNKATSPAAANQCRHIKADQSRCRANARHNSPYCFFHDPESAVDRDAARRSGGRERSRRAAVLPADTPNKPLTSAADVTELLAETINQVRRGEIDPRISNGIGYLAGILLKATERDDLAQRLARLESILACQPEDPESDSDLDSLKAFDLSPSPGGQA